MSKFHSRAVMAAGALLCVTLAACGASSGGGDILTVNGQAITRADLDKRLESSPASKQVLTQLVQQQLVEQYAKKNNVTVTDAEIAKKEDEIKAKYPPGQFDQIIAQQGLTDSDVKTILREQLVIEKAISPQVKISDAEVKAYFDKNHATLDKPERVRARHILVANQKTADDIEAKLKKNPNDFAALAKQYSTDPSTKDKGGELGFFGRGTMVPAFQDAAFSLPVNKISDPVKSPFGYHIIQVEEHDKAQPASLKGSHDQIVDTLKQQQEGQQIPVFLQSLRAQANIDVLDNRYRDLFPPPLPSPAPAAPAAPGSPAAAAPAPAGSGK